MSRIKRDLITYLLIIGFCIIMLVWAIPTYTPPYPGYGASPALVPVVAICVMLIMASLSLVFSVMALYFEKPYAAEESEYPEELEDGGGFTQVGRVNLKHLAGTMLPCVLLVVAIDYIGYILASLVFLLIFQYVIGSRKWLQSTIVAFAMTSVLYIVMRYGFGVPVPGPQFF